MKLELQEIEEHTEVLEIGSIRVSAYLRNGKTVIVLTCLNGADFINIQPTASNQVTVKASATKVS